MHIVTPLIIDRLPSKAEYARQYPNDAFAAKLAYRCAVRVWIRTRLSSEQNHRCAWCGCETTELRDQPHSSTIEHVEPLSNGGANEYSNMVMACSDCNHRRGVKPVDEFMQFVAAGKPRGSLSTKRQDVEFLRSNGFHVGTNTKPCRIRRSMDKVAALAKQRWGVIPGTVDTPC